MIPTDTTAQYQIVAKEIAAAVPSQWSKAWVTSEIGEHDMTENMFDYADVNGQEHWFDPPPQSVAAIGRAIRDLREAMRVPGKTPWSRCTFTLFPNGEFKFDVKYDD